MKNKTTDGFVAIDYVRASNWRLIKRANDEVVYKNEKRNRQNAEANKISHNNKTRKQNECEDKEYKNREKE